MRQNSFGKLWPVSALTLGGGGIGMVWGETTFDECVATVHDAVAAGINLIDLAPSYGDGRAERVVGEAFGGRLPDGVRITSKCNLGNREQRMKCMLNGFKRDGITCPAQTGCQPDRLS